MQDAEETLKVSAALTDHKKMIAELYDNKFRYLQGPSPEVHTFHFMNSRGSFFQLTPQGDCFP
jgi:hypothetical protein